MAQEKGTKKSEEDILSAVDAELAQALGGGEYTKLSEQRSDAMEYYLGEPYGNEQQGKSKVRTREVMDTIEWTKPELMKLFASGGDTVRFEPEGPDDVARAQQETDYVNYIFERKNPGFKILYEWINDGLLQKNGIVKAWWDPSVIETREDYEGLTQVELELLAAPDNVEIAELETVVTEEGETYNVGIIRSGDPKGIVIENIPPEEFLISPLAKCIQSSPFCAHRTQVSISDLNAMGYDTTEIGSDDGEPGFEEEKIARHSYDDTPDGDEYTQPADETMRMVWLTEAYIRLDKNGDGIAELLKVCKVGSTVLDVEEVECMPFAGWTPIIISHKFHGLSLADLVMDIQVIQSQLLRNILDNQYLQNNGRYAVLDQQVNLDDLLTSTVHGVVREKVPGAVRRLDTPQLGPGAFQMLEYMDKLREKRTGVSERTQGIESNQLGPNTAATAVQQVMSAAQQRIELIARVFAETGLKDLFKLIHKLVLMNDNKKHIFKLRDQYIEVDPSGWRERYDVSVVVGLGNGTRDQEMLHMNMILQQQQQLMANPATASLVSPQNVYNVMEDMIKAHNKAAAGRYFTAPDSPEAKQRAQQAKQAQQKQQQMMMQLEQKKIENESKKAGAAVLQAQAKQQDVQNDAQLGAQDLQRKQQEHADKMAIDRAELELEYELEKEQGRGVELG